MGRALVKPANVAVGRQRGMPRTTVGRLRNTRRDDAVSFASTARAVACSRALIVIKRRASSIVLTTLRPAEFCEKLLIGQRRRSGSQSAVARIDEHRARRRRDRSSRPKFESYPRLARHAETIASASSRGCESDARPSRNAIKKSHCVIKFVVCRDGTTRFR
jgi:hypothetical protein